MTKIITLLLAAAIAAAPVPLLAQQKQDTMGKKEAKSEKIAFMRLCPCGC